MSKKRLDHDDRINLQVGIAKGLSLRNVASMLKKSRSTIYREIANNSRYLDCKHTCAHCSKGCTDRSSHYVNGQCNMEDRTVTWFYDPHEDDDIEDEEMKKGRQYVTEDLFDFMSWFVMHVADKGFQQIRYYGFYSNKFKAKVTNGLLFSDKELEKMSNDTIWVNGLRKSFGYDPLLGNCGSYMVLNPELSDYGRKQDFG